MGPHRFVVTKNWVLKGWDLSKPQVWSEKGAHFRVRCLSWISWKFFFLSSICKYTQSCTVHHLQSNRISVACRQCLKEVFYLPFGHSCNTEAPGHVIEPCLYPNMPRNYWEGVTHTGESATPLKANFETQQRNGRAISISHKNAINGISNNTA